MCTRGNAGTDGPGESRTRSLILLRKKSAETGKVTLDIGPISKTFKQQNFLLLPKHKRVDESYSKSA